MTYSVTRIGAGGGTVSVTYAGPNGTSQQDADPPWEVDVPVLDVGQFFYLSATEADGNASSRFTCTITYQGEVIATADASGAFSSCQVDGSS